VLLRRRPGRRVLLLRRDVLLLRRRGILLLRWGILGGGKAGTEARKAQAQGRQP
jgi:hypothetical protein